MDRYYSADPSRSPRQCSDSSALLDREGAGGVLDNTTFGAEAAWKNLISGACCQHSGLQWIIYIKTSIEEKSESLKDKAPSDP